MQFRAELSAKIRVLGECVQLSRVPDFLKFSVLVLSLPCPALAPPNFDRVGNPDAGHCAENFCDASLRAEIFIVYARQGLGFHAAGSSCGGLGSHLEMC
jgi:hypothetical protein